MSRHLALVSSALLVLALVACKDAGGLDVNAPEGWRRFSEGAFRGAVHNDWTPFYVDTSEVEALSAELPGDVESALDAYIAAGNTELFLVYLEAEPVDNFTTYINVLGCEAEDVESVVSDPTKLAEYYNSVGVTATPHRRVEFQGRDFVMLKLAIQPTHDSYQVYIEKDGCYIQAILTTRKGDERWVEDFGTFVSYLEPNVSELRRGGTPTP